MILEESGYTDMWQKDRSADAAGRLENLKELIRSMEEFPDLGSFLEHISLVMDADSDVVGARVSIMTLHAAKGLEFATVFLPGWEEGLFPSQRSMDENGLSGLEEERRLAYVGLTRARKRAFISYAANRRLHGQWQSAMPSRFVDELPADHVELVAEPGLPTGARGGFAEFGGGDSWPRTRVMAPRSFKAPLIEGRATRISEPIPAGAGQYRAGDRVFHQKFGYGTVGAVSDDKLSIHFDKAGSKMVIANFVAKADVDGRIG